MFPRRRSSPDALQRPPVPPPGGRSRFWPSAVDGAAAALRQAAHAAHSRHRRRPRRLRSGLADRARAAFPSSCTRCAPSAATEAHRTARLAELVCSNSFRSDDAETNAVGVIHGEMRALGSLIMRSADAHQVPAGGALAVDRDGFSAAVEAAIVGRAADHASSAARSPACRPRTGTASSSPPAR